MRKRLLLSLCVLLAWLGFVVEGSHALFTDSATLAGNTITTGQADLQVSNSQNPSSTVYADIRPGFAMGINPGEADQHFFLLKNMSDSTVALDIDVAASTPGTDKEFPQYVSFNFVPVDENGAPTGTPVTALLADLFEAAHSLQVTIPTGAAQRFQVTTKMNQDYHLPNVSYSYDLVFTGTQHLGG